MSENVLRTCLVVFVRDSDGPYLHYMSVLTHARPHLHRAAEHVDCRLSDGDDELPDARQG